MRISDWSSDVCSSDLLLFDPTTATVAHNNMQGSTFLDECISGTSGGLLGMTLVYPLDTVKTRLQTRPHYTSPLHVCREMIAADGRSEERRVGKECVSPCRSRGSPDH